MIQKGQKVQELKLHIYDTSDQTISIHIKSKRLSLQKQQSFCTPQNITKDTVALLVLYFLCHSTEIKTH